MAGSAPTPPASRIEAAVHAARALLQQGNYAGALTLAEQLLARVPENRDVLYLVAVSQRYLGRTREALDTLTRFESAHPAYSRIFQERGHCHRAGGDTAAAIAAYRRAVELNPALPASWQGLAQLSSAPDAAVAARTAAHLSALPAAVVGASSLLADGEPAAAEQLVRQFLAKHPDDIEALRVLAQVLMRRHAAAEAQPLLERVLAAAPEHHAARYDYALLLAQRHRHAESLAQADRLLTVEPDHTAFLTVRANALSELGEHAQALAIFRALQARNPAQADLTLCIAHALKTLGQRQQAIAAYQAATRLRAGYGEAYWGLANLKTYRLADEEIAEMRAALAAPERAAGDHYHLHFALGKALEDRGEFADSFGHYAQGNALKRRETDYTPETLERAAAARHGRSGARGDLHRRPAAIRLHPARADPGLASASRGHLGAAADSAPGCRARQCRPRRGGLPAGTHADERRAAAHPGRAVPRRDPCLSPRPALFHRQDAEQLPPRRPDPPDPAEREDHRCPP